MTKITLIISHVISGNQLCMMRCVSATMASAADVKSVDDAGCPHETHFLCQDNSACIPHSWLCDHAMTVLIARMKVHQRAVQVHMALMMSKQQSESNLI